MQYANLGFQFTAAIVLGWAAGGWAGRKWGGRWAEEGGSLAGIVVGFVMLVRAAADGQKRQKSGKHDG